MKNSEHVSPVSFLISSYKVIPLITLPEERSCKGKKLRLWWDKNPSTNVVSATGDELLSLLEFYSDLTNTLLIMMATNLW